MKDDIKDKYNQYLSEHLKNVKKASNWLIKNSVFSLFDESCRDQIIDRLTVKINEHDRSKYSSEEFEPYAKYFFSEHKDEDEFNIAWHHHIINNPHHWNYWCFIDDWFSRVKTIDMPVEYILEMIADWWSFSWKDGNLYSIFDWYHRNKDSIVVSENTRRNIEKILNFIELKLDNNDKE